MNEKTISNVMRELAKRPRGKRSAAATEQSRKAAKLGAAKRWAKKSVK